VTPTDLITSAEARLISHHDSTWGFVRWARDLQLTEVRRPGGRLLWSRAEIEEKMGNERDERDERT